MPVETRASAARKSAIKPEEPPENVSETRAGDIEPSRKKRKRALEEPEDASSPTRTSDTLVEETTQRLADLRLDRQLEIEESDTDIIERNADGEYKFKIPIDSLDFFHRSAWGVKDSATEIVVNLVLLKHETGTNYGFCVHLEPGDLADKYHHNFITTDGPWRDMIVCNKASNFLTDALGRGLHAFLRLPEDEDDSILGKVLSKIKEVASSDPTKFCVICGDELPVTVWRPSPCTKDVCRQSLKRWSLETRLSPFLRCPKVLDFLLACLYTGIRPPAPPNSRALSTGNRIPVVRPPAPSNGGILFAGVFTPSVTPPKWAGFVPPGFTTKALRRAMDKFPPIDSETSISTLLSSGGDKAARERLLSWLCTDFEGTLVPAPPSTQVSFQESEQFLILNGPTEREGEFREELKKKRKNAVRGKGAFHGTPQPNLFSILHLGLKNVEGLVWYSSEASYSLGYNTKHGGPGVLDGPENSRFKNKTVLFGVEAVHPGGTPAVLNAADEATVALRYAYVLSPGIFRDLDHVPDGAKLRSVMEKTFATIRSGGIIQEQEMEAKEAQTS